MTYTIQQNITYQIIQSLMENVQKKIKIQELIKNMPKFLHQEFIQMIKQQMHSISQDHQRNNINSMHQQKIQQVKALNKDSLMPKYLPRENQQIDKVQTDIYLSSLRGSKRFNSLRGTKNILKKSSISGIPSMNQSSRSSKFSIGAKNKSKKKQREQIFISLNMQESSDDDPNIKYVRKIKQLSQKQQQRQNQQKTRRSKILQQKRQRFQQKYKQKQYTFDFQGNTIDFHQQQEPIKHHQIKQKFTKIEKNNITKSKLKNRRQVHQIVVKKKWNKKSEETQKFQATLQMPMFTVDQSNKRSSIGLPAQVALYHLKEYKKNFGGKFHRLQESLNTIDILNRTKTPKQHEDLFTSRRYFKDQGSQMLNQSIASQRSKQPNQRKLALPKLKGKYSTLDRYNQN